MLSASMASTKKPAAKKPVKSEGRKKSLLTEIGEEAMRKALLDTLVAQDWHLSKAAEVLGLGGPANVIRAIKALGLEEQYESAKKRGLIKRGARSAS